MADAAKIIERARANGADIVLQGDGLHVVNRGSLPAAAMDYIRENSTEIVAYLSGERTGGGPKDASPLGTWLTERQAEDLSRLLMAGDPGDPDWTWFVSRAQKILDSIVMPRVTA